MSQVPRWKRLRERTGQRLTRLGERTGASWLTYNPLVFWWFHDLARANAPAVAAAIRAVFPAARRCADVGAGTGTYAAELRKVGFDVGACEHGRVGRLFARGLGVRSRPFDLTKEPPARLPGPWDLAVSLEVAEHLPEPLGDRLVGFLTGLAPAVVFSAAHPGQGGVGHVNEQPDGYWIDRFARAGAGFDAAATADLRGRLTAAAIPAWWLPRNVIVVRSGGGRL